MTALDEFSALARSWAQFYRTRETTYISVRLGEIWYLLYSRDLFHVDNPVDAPPIYIETPSIRAGQFRTKIEESDASEIVERVLAERGKVTVAQWSVSLSSVGALQDRFDRLYPARSPGQMRLPTYVLESGGVDLRNSKDAFTLELLACNTPFESLEELCNELMIPIAPGEPTQPTHAEIILGNLFRFDNTSSLKDDHLNLTIVASRQVKQEHLRISAKVFYAPNLPPRRLVIPPDSFSWAERDGKTYNECAFEMSDGQLALVFVSYRGEFCHKWWLRDQSKSFSQSYQFHRLLDTDNRIERTFFDSKNDFEHRVALLLSLMNLTILPYGGIPELQDAPDILAYSSNNDLYVVECTTGDIDHKGKLQRLCDRTRKIATRAQQSPIAIANLFSVVFTSLPRTDISPHLAKLEALKIAVFCKDDIELMIERVEAPPTPEEILTAVQALIPTTTHAQDTPVTLQG
jgi:hypothetical protein